MTLATDKKLIENVRALGGMSGQSAGLMEAVPSILDACRLAAKNAIDARKKFEDVEMALVMACSEEKVPLHALDKPSALSTYGSKVAPLIDMRIAEREALSESQRAEKLLNELAFAQLATDESLYEVANNIRELGLELQDLAEKTNACRRELLALETLISLHPEVRSMIRTAGAGNTTHNGQPIEHERIAARALIIADHLGDDEDAK